MVAMAIVSLIFLIVGLIGMHKYPTEYGYAISAIIGISGLPWPTVVAIFFFIGKCTHTSEPLAALYEV
jgi:hypothetical protein